MPILGNHIYFDMNELTEIRGIQAYLMSIVNIQEAYSHIYWLLKKIWSTNNTQKSPGSIWRLLQRFTVSKHAEGII